MQHAVRKVTHHVKEPSLIRNSGSTQRTNSLVNPDPALTRRDYLNWRLDSLDPSAILFEESYGNRASGGPLAIFLQLVDDTRFNTYHFYWSVAEDIPIHHALSAHVSNPQVTIIRHGSPEYFHTLATARVLINDSTFLPYFVKREDQLYINTWHGVPYKTMGKDNVGDRPVSRANTQRNLMLADYLVSSCSRFTDLMVGAYDLKGFAATRILEIGDPANELVRRADRKQIRKNLGLSDDEKLVLYCPTWRGLNNKADQRAVDDQLRKVEELQEAMPLGYRLIAKLHSFATSGATIDSDAIYTGDLNEGELMAAADSLITDYSSIFFKYLSTQRPIVFYQYDQNEYSSSRGFYFDPADLPGPICSTVDEVIASLTKGLEALRVPGSEFIEFCDTWIPHDSGSPSALIADLIADPTDEPHGRVLTDYRPRLLINPGGLLLNGITSTFMSLLHHLDYSQLNVGVFVGRGAKAEILDQFPPETKVFFHQTTNLFISDEEATAYDEFVVEKQSSWDFTNTLETLFTRETKRVFGSMTVDAVADFSGYNLATAAILTCLPSDTRTIWLHNNMASEYEKRFPGLKGIFALYDRFDHRVCVSQDSFEENSNDLPQLTPPVLPPTGVVSNTFDLESLLVRRDLAEVVDFDGIQLIRDTSPGASAVRTTKEVLFDPDSINLINIARYSVEKNQANLIKAFVDVVKTYPQAKLYIVGHGPLEQDLKTLVNSLNLNDSVFITGRISNPIPLLSRCDGFILPSLSEGQPVVILEAFSCGVPVIAADIAGPRALLDTYGGGLLIPGSDPRDISRIISEFLSNPCASQNSFDAVDFNKNAISAFYKAVELGDVRYSDFSASMQVHQPAVHS